MPGCFGHDEANRPKHYGHTDLKPAASTMAARWTKIVSSLRNWKYIAPVVVGGSGLGHLTAETTTAGLSEPKPRTRTEAVAAMSKPLQLKTQVFGNYENRLRRYSSPEKLFEYFASVSVGGERFMTPDDFIRAITPYNPSIDDWTAVGSTNSKFTTQQLPAPLSQAELAQLKEDVAILFSSSSDAVAAGERCVALLQLGRGVPNDVMRTNEARAVPALRATGTKLPAFTSRLASLGIPMGSHRTGDSSIASFAALVDQDGDGLLSFGEFMFFLTLLAIPPEQFTLAFGMLDSDGDGELDAGEFEVLMDVMRRKHPTGNQVRDVSLLGTPLGRLSASGLTRNLFESHGATKLSSAAFTEYVRKVQYAVREREFARSDYDGSADGKLSPYEFAMYLLSFAPKGSQEEFMSRAKALKISGSSDDVITKEDFFTFAELLLRLDDLQAALNAITGGVASRGVTQDEFCRATHAVLVGVVPTAAGPSSKATPYVGLSKPLVSVLFSLFDTNRDNSLDQAEFMDIMFARASRGLHERRDLGLFDKATRFTTCVSTALLK